MEGMENRLSRLEARLEQIASRVEGFEQRLAAVERRAPGAAAARAHGAPAAEEPLLGPASDPGAIVALLGRTLLVLAGAYLLRALTDSGTLAAGPGVLLGLVFALVWIVMAARVGGHGDRTNAAFHGIAFILIALPMLFEATTRFHFLSPAAAAAGLGSLAAVALAVAAWRRVHALAWITTLGALATALALMLATAELGPMALFLVSLGVATLWMGYLLEWQALRWPVALAADLTILVLSGRAVTSGAADSASMALAVQVLLLAAYLGSVGARTLFLRRDVIPFEVVQSVAATAVGLGGAAYVTTSTGVGALPLGLATLALAAGCYGVAVAFLERRQARRRNFYFYTSAALVFTMVGCALVLPNAHLAMAYAILGLAAACAGRLSKRIVFHAHGAVYLVAAVVLSGLLMHVLYGLGLPAVPGHAASAGMLAVLALCVAAIWGLGFAAADHPPPPARAPRLIVVILALGGLLGIVVAWLAPAIAGSEVTAAHAGRVATLRTALLVACVLALAWADHALEFVEGAWLVYPLLILTGLKFVFEDFRAGRPATLFLSFALYGLALIVGPWLCRHRSGAKESARKPTPGGVLQ